MLVLMLVEWGDNATLLCGFWIRTVNQWVALAVISLTKSDSKIDRNSDSSVLVTESLRPENTTSGAYSYVYMRLQYLLFRPSSIE